MKIMRNDLLSRTWLLSLFIVTAGCQASTPTSQQAEQPPAAPVVAVDTVTPIDAPVAEAESPRLATQCNRLIAAINAEQDVIRNAKTDDAEAMRKLADNLDTVAKKMEAVEVSDGKLIKLRGDYIELISDFSKTSRFTANAMTKKDLEELIAAQKQLKEISPREDKVVNAINRYCQGD